MNVIRTGLLSLILLAGASTVNEATAQRKKVGEVHVYQTRWVHKNNPRLVTYGRISLYYFYKGGYSSYELLRMRTHKQSFSRLWRWQSDQIIARSPIYR